MDFRSRTLPTLSLAALLFLTLLAGPQTASAATKTFVVTSAATGGPTVAGTLTWAIYQVNYQGAETNVIQFNIPGGAAEIEITLSETLFVARPVVINAATQPGYSGQPRIRLNCNGLDSGFNIVPAGNGLPGGGGTTIQGFRITNFRSNGITISRGADQNIITNNQIGFTPLSAPGSFSRNSAVFARTRGIGIQSSSNAIRGNVISGVETGITVGDDINAPTGSVYQNNVFERNFIGTDAAGATKIGNDTHGIFLGAGAQGNLIGPGNVLSGMGSTGVQLLHATATGNRIFGNIIGLDAAGTVAIPNGDVGVLIANGAANNWVGGPYGGSYAGNVISGNRFGAVAIGAAQFPGPSGTNNNFVEGNFIGTSGGGTQAVGTQVSGVIVQSNAKRNIIRKNVIAGHQDHGIVFSGVSENAMYGNWIGVTDKGATIGNGSFGAYLFDSSTNVVQPSASAAGPGTEQNVFGSNNNGPVGVYGASTGNVINLTPPPMKRFTVTTATGGRDVVGSLTWAIYQANYQGGEINYIDFNIPGSSGEIEVTPAEPLYIARPMIINGATQSGDASYTGPPRIRINCNRFESGFTIVAAGGGLPGGGGSTIQGLRIINYTSNAITILRGADRNVIASNEIGFAPLAAAGTYVRNVTSAPLCRGIGIQSDANVIRGNTISGVDNGITVGENVDIPAAITGATCKNNSFEKNFIGTDPTGTVKIGNDSDAIFLGAGSQQTLIGPGNVLSGNASAGVELLHTTATGNKIFGNIIGLNASGTATIPNDELGILIANGAANNQVGGPAGGAFSGNIISANRLGGIAIGTSEWPGPDGSNNNSVEGNFIGTDGAKTTALGTQGTGITIQSKSKGNTVRNNVIVGHVNHGIALVNATANALYGNWIGLTNLGVAIANNSFGVYLQDASDNVVNVPATAAGPGTERNTFGVNTNGAVGVYGTSSNNIIDVSNPPSPTTSPSPTPAAARLVNISTRMRVETGDNALIAGFIVTGTGSKKVLLRGLGPSLPVPGALANPTLTLDGGAMFNDDWRSSQETEIRATTVPPANDLESAIVATLEPGAHTVVLRGASNGTGVGLVEVYDLETGTASQLANISTRGPVQTGESVMIGGLIIGEGGPSRILLRAIGPSLPVPGALQDPTLELIDSNGGAVLANDDWRSSQEAEIRAVLPPTSDREAALIATLTPGAYTTIVRGKNGTTGVALVEGYNLQ